MSDRSALAPLLAHLRREPSRTWSLIVTLYGDAVAPRGGHLWLGTVLEIFAAIDTTGNGVRTAMSRLAADGWLERNRVGRNSYYRLAEKGRVEFAHAARRIYGARRAAWDGAFRLAVLDGAEPESSRLALAAAGFALLSPGVLVAPAATALDTPADIIVLRATAEADDLPRLAARVWPAQRLAEGYRRFLAVFEPWTCQTERGVPLSALEALVARLLLIHEYRRLVLRDPMLPDALLPEAWPGHDARALCSRLYGTLLPESERWLDEHALAEGGKLPPPPASLWERFHD